MGKSKKCKKDKRKSNSDSDEWVETPETSKQTIIEEAGPTKSEDKDDSNWNTVFSCTLVSKEKKNKEREDQPILDKPGQHPRELNPYWKRGGTGLPEGSKTTEKRALAGASDAGLQWLLRAKKRLVEQSEETGASVEQLAIERWGSLANLNRKITEAEELSSFKAKRPSFRKPDHREEPRSRKRSSTRSRSRSPRRRRRTRSRSDDEEYTRSRYRSRSKSRERERLPKDRKSESKMREVRHVSDKVSDPQIKRTPSWMKKQENESEIASETTRQAVPALEEEHKQEPSSMVGLYMTEEEMNKLAAKILKAELMGRTTEAGEMKEKLEAARKSKETVILTRTDVRGMTRPLEKPQDGKGVPSRSKKVPTHQDKQRIRYFGDDEKYSLREMFEREKLGTAEDQNMMFARLAGKGLDKTDEDYTVDEVFISRAQMNESDARQAEKDKQHAIKEYKQQSRALEGCNRCLDNREMIKHLIISVGSKVYLALPAHTPLTSGHCLIIPAQHVSCSLQTDEDVWEEIQRFRKALVSMFSEEDEDSVFFESAMNLKKWPHMVIECVPLPREVGDVAPIYFKKAILESEGEWTQNKKLIELRGRDIRRAVPKALPYFSCDFGNESGFAHVIEEEREFPKNFAQEIIGGMLDLDHSIWRKPKREDFELQMARINDFKEKWKKYDFSTKI